MSGLELWPNSLPRQEQQAPQEPESQSFQVIFSSGGNNLQAPEEFLRYVVFANRVFKGQVEIELSKIIFITTCLAKKLKENRQIFGD